MRIFSQGLGPFFQIELLYVVIVTFTTTFNTFNNFDNFQILFFVVFLKTGRRDLLGAEVAPMCNNKHNNDDDDNDDDDHYLLIILITPITNYHYHYYHITIITIIIDIIIIIIAIITAMLGAEVAPMCPRPRNTRPQQPARQPGISAQLCDLFPSRDSPQGISFSN